MITLVVTFVATLVITHPFPSISI